MSCVAPAIFPQSQSCTGHTQEVMGGAAHKGARPLVPFALLPVSDRRADATRDTTSSVNLKTR